MTTLLSPARAARLLWDASLRAGAFDPNQPRDENGRWTDSDFALTKDGDRVVLSYGEPGAYDYFKDSPSKAKYRAELHALDSGKELTLDYLNVTEAEQRKGLATELVTRMRKAFPGHSVKTTDTLTDEGKSLLASFVAKGQAIPIRKPAKNFAGEKIRRTSYKFKSLGAAYPIHTAADRHAPKISLAVRAAFALGRRAYRAGNDPAAAVERALNDTLPGILERAALAGADATEIRAAQFDPNQPRDENGRWVAGSGPQFVAPGTANSETSDEVTHAREVLNRLPKELLAESTVERIELFADSSDAANRIDEHLSKIGEEAPEGGARGIFDRASGTMIATTWVTEDAAESGRNIYHEFAHSLKDRIQDPDWEQPYTEEWYFKSHGPGAVFVSDQDEGFAEAFSDYFVTRSNPTDAKEFDEQYPQTVALFEKWGWHKRDMRAARTKPKRESPKVTAARRWAKKHAAALVTDISDTTRKRVKAAVVEFGNLNNMIERIAQAIGDEDRAEVIARTESMRAAHAGQRIAWQDAIDNGLLPETVTRTWITTPDDKLCPQCDDLDGRTADMDGEYLPGIEIPPAHPNCRCTEGLA